MKQDANAFDAFDLSEILTEEARMLQKRSWSSARMVVWIISLAALLLAISGAYLDAVIWAALAGTMVALTLIYANVVWPKEVTPEQTQSYLRGHVFVTALTGLVWGGFAIYQTDPASEIKTFIAGVFLTSITSGGGMEGTVYRPGYIALAVTSLLPFGTALVLFSVGPIQVFGLFMFLYFAFCYITNEKVSNRTRQGIITELGRDATRQVYEKTAEIERLNAEKTRFMAAISHDMSQPLVAQKHLLRALRTRLKCPENQHLITIIEQTVSSQQHLLSALVDFSQLEVSEVDLSLVSIDVPAVIEQLEGEFSDRARERSISIQLDVADANLVTDRHVLLRVLRNLLSNAIKYSFDGSTIILRVRTQDGEVELTISDDGPGIAEEQQARVLEEYVRLPNDQNQPGLGLGLAISSTLAELLGGRLELHSSPGDGTKACLFLPEGVQTEQQDSADELPFVLVIGRNDDTIHDSWSDFFSTWMWKFAHATDEGRAKLLTNTLGIVPDIIIWDPKDPLTSQRPKLSESDTIPVLVVDRLKTHFDVSPADPVLQAPFTPEQLRSKIELLL